MHRQAFEMILLFLVLQQILGSDTLTLELRIPVRQIEPGQMVDLCQYRKVPNDTSYVLTKRTYIKEDPESVSTSIFICDSQHFKTPEGEIYDQPKGSVPAPCISAFALNQNTWNASTGTIASRFGPETIFDSILLCNHHHDGLLPMTEVVLSVELEPVRDHPETKIALAMKSTVGLPLPSNENSLLGFCMLEEPANISIYAYRQHAHWPGKRIITYELMVNASGQLRSIGKDDIPDGKNNMFLPIRDPDQRLAILNTGDKILYKVQFEDAPGSHAGYLDDEAFGVIQVYYTNNDDVVPGRTVPYTDSLGRFHDRGLIDYVGYHSS